MAAYITFLNNDIVVEFQERSVAEFIEKLLLDSRFEVIPRIAFPGFPHEGRCRRKNAPLLTHHGVLPLCAEPTFSPHSSFSSYIDAPPVLPQKPCVLPFSVYQT